MPQTPLEFATTKELLDELAARSEAMIFASKPKNESDVVDERTTASDSTCIGMGVLLVVRMVVNHFKGQ